LRIIPLSFLSELTALARRLSSADNVQFYAIALSQAIVLKGASPKGAVQITWSGRVPAGRPSPANLHQAWLGRVVFPHGRSFPSDAPGTSADTDIGRTCGRHVYGWLSVKSMVIMARIETASGYEQT